MLLVALNKNLVIKRFKTGGQDLTGGPSQGYKKETGRMRPHRSNTKGPTTIAYRFCFVGCLPVFAKYFSKMIKDERSPH
jgi:hypothetical protein